MDCPKCGVAQDDGREDCASCGIVFARWEAAQMRRITQNTPMVQSQGSPADGVPVSRWLIFGALFFVVVIGVMWTKSRREARANRDVRKEGMALLNDINKKGNKERSRLEEESRRAREMVQAMSNTPKAVKRPVGFEEADATRVIEQCSGFTERSSIKLPAMMASSDDYPQLPKALELRILEQMPNDYKLWPGPGVGGMQLVKHGNEYEIDLGYRRVVEITQLSGGVDRAEARFRWMWQGRVAAETLLTGDSYSGVAELLKKDGAWRVTGLSLGRTDNTTVPACKGAS